jgi:hypothetical protein
MGGGWVLLKVSLIGIALVMLGSFLFPDTAEKYRKQLPLVLGGLILLGVGNALLAAFGG